MSQTILNVPRKTSRSGYLHELGRRVAELLAGAWRDSEATIPTLSETELSEIVPLLCESGAGALAWWKIRNTPLANTESGRELHDVYRRHRLSALVHEREIAYVLSLLRAEGIEPALIKGWAIARLYPDAGLRPYGDIDLCIRPDQFEQAAAALKCLEAIDGHYVDLHSGFTRIGQTRPGDGIRRLRRFKINPADMRVWDELFSRSQLVQLCGSTNTEPGAVATGSQEPSKVRSEPEASVTDPVKSVPGAVATGSQVMVRVPGDEDHLRILSAHLLRSGARRPPWLCDVALLIESIAKDFDWDVCLRDRLHDNWVANAVLLAHEALGANMAHTPFVYRTTPSWLIPAVLRQWARTRVQSPKSNVQSPAIARRLQTPDSRLRTSLIGLLTRFDNPVRATAAVGGQFNNWPRLPYRLAELMTRIPEIPQQLLLLVRQLQDSALSSKVRAAGPGEQRVWNAKLRLTEE